MTPLPLERLSQPLPQVGAVLCYDSELDAPRRYDGNKHWKLTGSCVLLAPQTILTIGHTMVPRDQSPERGRFAAFFPYTGLLPIAEMHWESQVRGDNLALARLEEPVPIWPPLRQKKISSAFKTEGRALVCGYGSWSGESAPFEGLQGLQQQNDVSLGPPEAPGQEGWRHYDNLDLSWSAAENRLIAGRGNSGGPFLFAQDDGSRVVAGISRENTGDQQAGSWITWQRTRWLAGAIPEPDQGGAGPRSDWRPLRITAEEGRAERFAVPPGTRQIRVTLNASQGMRLQIGVVPSSQADGLLARLVDDKEAAGRFLCRTADLPEGTGEITVGVCRVASSPVQAGQEEVLAQLCVAFL
jgi:hypothetical protein